MKLSDSKLPTKFNLLQVGEPGSGKTTRALTATQFGPLLVIDADGKLVELRDRLNPEIVAKTDVELVTAFEQVEALVEACRANPTKYATVVVDTWSRLHELTLAEAKRLNPKGDGRQIFGAAKERNRTLLSKILTLPQNVIINTHVGREMDSSEAVKLTVSTAGSFGQEMPQFFNEVHYCYLDLLAKHKVRGEPSNLIVARTTLPPAMLANGTFTDLSLKVFASRAYKVGV